MYKNHQPIYLFGQMPFAFLAFSGSLKSLISKNICVASRIFVKTVRENRRKYDDVVAMQRFEKLLYICPDVTVFVYLSVLKFDC